MARKGEHRLLIQVRGSRGTRGKFPAPPESARALGELAASLGCHAFYGFAYLASGGTVIRFALASEVATFADEDEAACPGTNRFHVSIDQFVVSASEIESLLVPESA